MKKIIKLISLAIVITVLNCAVLINTVQAMENDQIDIYTKGVFNRIIKYNGILVKTTYAVHQENGIEYPAYCLNVELEGVGEKIPTYETENQGKITDERLWRVIINGYPYKSLRDLEVESIEEAYTATKQAIYCYLYDREVTPYTGVNESGDRVVNAMRIILDNAKKSTETIDNYNVDILGDKKWTEDGEYIKKEYNVASDINISQYTVSLENAPEGTIILDEKQVQKTTFNSSEKFKILIPIKCLNESNKFNIKVKTEMETKPVFYGKAPSDNLQNYALTAYSFEDIDTEIKDQYPKNETLLKIIKLNQENQKLQGAVFEILDQEGKTIQTIETNSEGESNLIGILPGKYIIKEVKAPDGYEINEKIIEINLKLNEEKIIKIKNNKIEFEEPEKTKQIIEIEEPVKQIKKLPVTGM